MAILPTLTVDMCVECAAVLTFLMAENSQAGRRGWTSQYECTFLLMTPDVTTEDYYSFFSCLTEYCESIHVKAAFLVIRFVNGRP